VPKPYYTLEYQFGLADNALHEARHLLKARYYTSCLSQAYQVAHRCAAGLLFGIEAGVHTEKDVGIGFEAAFVSSNRSDPKFAKTYRRLAHLRQKADFDYDYVADAKDAEEAMALAEEFYQESQRLRTTLTVPR
jgi:uncharacterized protein (UPF0332 family)